MLKIVDKTGKLRFVLNDEDEQPMIIEDDKVVDENKVDVEQDTDESSTTTPSKTNS